jgi:hypothetical protein
MMVQTLQDELSDLLHEPVVGFWLVGWQETGDGRVLNVLSTPAQCCAHPQFDAAVSAELAVCKSLVDGVQRHVEGPVETAHFSFPALAALVGMEAVSFLATVDHMGYLSVYRDYEDLSGDPLIALASYWHDLASELAGGHRRRQLLH